MMVHNIGGEDTMNIDDNERRKTIRDIASYSHLGITFAASILLCLFGGKYLDKKLGTEPYLMMVGAFFGAGAGFYYIVKELIQRQDRNDD